MPRIGNQAINIDFRQNPRARPRAHTGARGEKDADGKGKEGQMNGKRRREEGT